MGKNWEKVIDPKKECTREECEQKIKKIGNKCFRMKRKNTHCSQTTAKKRKKTDPLFLHKQKNKPIYLNVRIDVIMFYG